MRPQGSNADEWNLFLSEHLDNRVTTSTSGMTYVAIQIAESLDSARASHAALLAAAKETMDAIKDGECGPNASYYFHLLKAAITKAEELAP